VLPEHRFPGDQIGDLVFIAIHPIDPEILTTDQHGHIGPSVSGDGQLMQHLALIGNRNAFLPLRGRVIAGCLDFQDAPAFFRTTHLPIQIGQHETVSGAAAPHSPAVPDRYARHTPGPGWVPESCPR
jgi:hypothetical protein